MKKPLLITNIKDVTVKLPNGNILRLHVGAITLENRIPNESEDKCYPMIVGWNENPSVEFADFQLWLGCRVEESEFVNSHGQKFPLKKGMLVPGSAVTCEFFTSLEFKDGTKIDFTTRDSSQPIEVSDYKKSLRSAIKKYGYSSIHDD